MPGVPPLHTNSRCANARKRNGRRANLAPWIGLAGLLLLASCHSAPSVALPVGQDLVRADEVTIARSVAAHLQAIKPRVLAFVPEAEDRTLEIWAQDELPEIDGLEPFGAAAYTVLESGPFGTQVRIHLQDSVADSEAVIAHELVHAVLGREWHTLPPVWEEGLCEYVASQLVDGYEQDEHPRHVAAVAIALGVRLRCDFGDAEEHADLPPQAFNLALQSGWRFPRDFRLHRHDYEPADDWGNPRITYAAAYLLTRSLCERDGLAALLSLCERAGQRGLREVPLSWLVGSEDPDMHSLESVVREHVNEHSLQILAELLLPELVDTLLGVYRPLRPQLSGEQFLVHHPLFVRVDGLPAKLNLADVPLFRSLWTLHWAEPSSSPE